MKLNIANIKFSNKPIIVSALSDEDIKLVKRQELKFVGLIELRVDTFKDVSPSYVEGVFKHVKKRFKKPLLGTVRDIKEGGKRLLSENQRLELFKTIAPIADVIDIELNSKIYGQVAQIAHSKGKSIIASYHNFKETPDSVTLSKLLSKAKSASPEIIKFATMANNLDDVGRLLCFTIEHMNEHIVSISLGEKGRLSRVINPLFGSLLTYGYIGKPKADGQMHVKQLVEMIKFLQRINVDN
ncbi:MAG: type I 3-dehydroquinate dehydratase [bacterium]